MFYFKYCLTSDISANYSNNNCNINNIHYSKK